MEIPHLLFLILLLFIALFTTFVGCMNQFKPVTCAGSFCGGLTRVTVDLDHGYVFVGARSHLYQLNLDLGQLYSVEIDQLSCSNSDNCKNNGNKILLVDTLHNRLLTCHNSGSLRCALHDVNNIRKILHQSKDVDKCRIGKNDIDSNEFVVYTTESDGQDVAGAVYVAATKNNDNCAAEPQAGFTAPFYKFKLSNSNAAKDMFKPITAFFKGTFGVHQTISSFRQYFTGAYFMPEYTNPYMYFVKSYTNTTLGLVNKSYISRFCHGQYHDAAQIELPISCRHKGQRFDQVTASHMMVINREKWLIASFVPSSSAASGGTVVCKYRLFELELKFSEAAFNCTYGTPKKFWPVRIPWTDEEASNCDRRNPTDDRHPVVCGEDTPLTNLQVNMNYTEDAFYQTNRIKIISMESVAKNKTCFVLFLGTDDGKVVKVKMESDSNVGEEFEVMQIDKPTRSGSTVKTLKIVVDNTRPEMSSIYALTPRLVAKFLVQNCSQYTTCQACSASKDPFCGWCTLENKCSVSYECSRNGEDYLFIEVGKTCPKLQSSKSSIAFEHLPKKLILTATSIPYSDEMAGDYMCRFDNNDRLVKSANLRRKSGSYLVICTTPGGRELTEFPDNESKVLKLELIYQRDGGRRGGSSISIGAGKVPAVAVASVDLDVYKCSKYTSCFSCLQNEYDCQWNSKLYSCYSSGDGSVPADQLIGSQQACPAITGFDSNADQNSTSGTTYISDGTEAPVLLKMKNIYNIYEATKNTNTITITCNVRGDDDGEVQEVQAVFKSSDKIECRRILGRVKDGNVWQRGKLTVSMKRSGYPVVQIDSTIIMAVESYKCGLGSGENSCGNCLTANRFWKCGWCSSNSACTERNACTPITEWLPANDNRVCANPVINSFLPLKAPVGTATNITLSGKNFDQQLKMRILVAGTLCKPLEIIGCCKLVCRIQKDTAQIAAVGNVTLCITDDAEGKNCRPESQYQTFTNQLFNFVNPSIEDVSPDKVLSGWGDRLTLRGQHLDAGNKLLVQIASQTCVVDESTRTSTQVECDLTCKNKSKTTTSRRKRSSGATMRRHKRHTRHRRHSRSKRSSSKLMMSFDGGDRLQIGFSIVNDVTIRSVEPRASIRSGGIRVLVNGTYLRAINQPVMKTTNMEKVYKGLCTGTEDANVLSCSTPDLSKAPLYPTDVEFEISSGNECSSIKSTQTLKYDPDPVLYEFQKLETYTPGNILSIEGVKICPPEGSCDNGYVEVLVDGEASLCNVVRVDVDKIQCSLSGLADGSHKIKVRIGGYSADVGKIDYVANQTGMSMTTVIIIIVVIIIFLIIVVLGLYKCHKKMESSNKEVKEIQFKMNKLESEVAKACKEAFAELQTDSEEARVLLGKNSSGPPYHDYRIYLIRVLFPDPSDSDKLLDLLLTNDSGSMMTNQKRLAMTRFLTLLRNEGFLILFIHTLESQRSFSMKDKAYVAGLVLIVMQDRLAYATHILEKLLAELITKGVSKESHPKLLFRRTESVAEKMLTHWFSMLLYGFLVAGAGESLYVLYRRLCQLIDKGPVDAMTNDARYSLSEDKLLRQTLEAKRVVLKVKNYFEPNDPTVHSVKVLTCDSISQVKRKILDYLYGHIAYSQRIHPHKVDLEWRKKYDQGGIILRDEDSTTQGEGEWKHINTLEHYKVCDGETISVIPKKVNTLPHNYASSSTRSYASGFTKQDSTTRLLPSGDGSLPRKPNHKQTGASRPETPSTQPENIRYYHLTKPNDHQEVRLGNNNNNGNKMVAEVYLTRLLTAKVALQKHVDDLFETIFSVEQRDQTLPIAVRHMFGFLDDQARKHNIQDQEIVHTWKTNCLPLRFWVNLIKNPEFVFDIYKSSIVDCCLSVIGQTFMDSCALGRQPLTKDSPTNKLLYAKEIPKYKTWVSKYYSDISRQPRLDRRQIESYFGEESRRHENDFNTEAALTQLFEYVQKHSTAIHKALNDCTEGKRLQLSNQLAQIEEQYRSPTPAHTHNNQYGSNGTLSVRRPYS